MVCIVVDDQIKLTLLENRHAERIFELINSNREHLKRWLPWVDFTNNVADSKEFIELSRKRYIDNNGFNLAIVFKKEIVGVIGLHLVVWRNKHTSIGYWLGEGYQGNGIMTRATKALTTYCFEELGMNRVEIPVVPQNIKSRAIPERLGYKIEGTVRQCEWLDGEFYDHHLYGMLKNEWGQCNDL